MVTLRRTVLRAMPATKPVSPARAPFERPRMSIGDLTAADVMFTTRPNSRSIMPSTVARMSSMAVSMLALSAAFQSSRVHSRKSPGGGPPALLTRMSGSGQAASTAARPSGVVMSPGTAVTRAPGVRPDRGRRLLEGRGGSRRDPDLHTLRRERVRAPSAQALARRADDRAAPCDTEIHRVPLRFGCSLSGRLSPGRAGRFPGRRVPG